MNPGLVSVTFRQFSPEEIIALVVQARLKVIEWGGDVHVPHGDLGRARQVRRMTEDAGIGIAAYGSYYQVGLGEPLQFEAVLETAVALGAPVIRVWAGRQASATADAEYRRYIVFDAQRIAELAAVANVPVAFEFHRNTLSDSGPAARQLLEEIGHDNVRTYWQPPIEVLVTERIAGLEMLLPWLSNVHMYHWTLSPRESRPLAEGAEEWRQYLRLIASTKREHCLLLEFVREDDPANFLRDAATLRSWLGTE